MNSVDGSEGTSAAEEGIATRLRPRPPRPISLATTSGGTGRAPVWRDTVIGPFNPRASSYPHDVKARLVRAMCEQPHGLCVLRNVIDGSFLNRIQKRTTFDQCIEAYGKGLFGLDPYNITSQREPDVHKQSCRGGISNLEGTRGTDTSSSSRGSGLMTW